MRQERNKLERTKRDAEAYFGKFRRKYGFDNPETKKAEFYLKSIIELWQAALAQAHGIHAFCFYFYWFQGKTLLEAPIAQWLDDDEITMPFCLCWANEGWSRRWDGRADDILVPQGHDAGDDIEFIAHVARYLRDPRYLRIDGKPLLLVYRPGLMPEPDRTAERWRSSCSIAVAAPRGSRSTLRPPRGYACLRSNRSSRCSPPSRIRGTAAGHSASRPTSSTTS